MLKVTRNQLASFITDPATIKQFEALFNNVNNLNYSVAIAQVESSLVTGFSVEVGNSSISSDNDIDLFLNLSGTLATGTIVFPKISTLRDMQTITITTTNEVTALSIDIQDASNIYGDVATISAGSFLKYKYNSSLSSWFRLG